MDIIERIKEEVKILERKSAILKKALTDLEQIDSGVLGDSLARKNTPKVSSISPPSAPRKGTWKERVLNCLSRTDKGTSTWIIGLIEKENKGQWNRAIISNRVTSTLNVLKREGVVTRSESLVDNRYLWSISDAGKTTLEKSDDFPIKLNFKPRNNSLPGQIISHFSNVEEDSTWGITDQIHNSNPGKWDPVVLRRRVGTVLNRLKNAGYFVRSENKVRGVYMWRLAKDGDGPDLSDIINPFERALVVACDGNKELQEAVLSRSRKAKLVTIRVAIVRWCRENLDYSYKTIGVLFGRDHSSIIHLYKKAKDGSGSGRFIYKKIKNSLLQASNPVKPGT